MASNVSSVLIYRIGLSNVAVFCKDDGSAVVGDKSYPNVDSYLMGQSDNVTRVSMASISEIAQVAQDLMETGLEPRSAIKQSGSIHGIEFGEDMGRLVESVERHLYVYERFDELFDQAFDALPWRFTDKNKQAVKEAVAGAYVDSGNSQVDCERLQDAIGVELKCSEDFNSFSERIEGQVRESTDFMQSEDQASYINGLKEAAVFVWEEALGQNQNLDLAQLLLLCENRKTGSDLYRESKDKVSYIGGMQTAMGYAWKTVRIRRSFSGEAESPPSHRERG
jgi:hypothetical protein